jgi:hypothetical protein
VKKNILEAGLEKAIGQALEKGYDLYRKRGWI